MTQITADYFLFILNKWGQSKIAGSLAGGKNGGDFTLTPDILPTELKKT